jgi:hypothetical protein
MFVRSAWCFGLSLALVASCAWAQPAKPRPVQAGQLFKGGFVNVKAPNSSGWSLAESSSNSIGFTKPGLGPGETLVAQVLLLPLAPTRTPSEFVALIKEGVRKNHDPQRFAVLESRIDYTTERKYPCARYYGVLNDKEARISFTETRPLRLEVHGLYCRHPVQTEGGFAAIYSYKGYGTYPKLAERAQEFIQGVEPPAGQ